MAGDHTIQTNPYLSFEGECEAAFTFYAHSKSTSDAERIFRELASGGRVVMPLDKTFWAARFGMLVDRFGIPWLINCEGDQPGSKT